MILSESASPVVTWAPDPSHHSRMSRFMEFVSQDTRGQKNFANYTELWKWSVDEPSEFWDALRRFFDVRGEGFVSPALFEECMPGAVWYPGSTVNFAENVLRPAQDSAQRNETAVLNITEDDELTRISWAQLAAWVGTAAHRFKELGVAPGDRIVAVLPNIPEAIVGLLASASIGAVWSVCSPDLAADAVVSRFAQLEPTILIGTDGYSFNGKRFDRRDHLDELVHRLPSLQHVLEVRSTSQTRALVETPTPARSAFPGLPSDLDAFQSTEFERLGFDHPLWVLFSSGTTGTPKGIVHGHGGILLESLKNSGLAHDMGPGDLYYVAANTSWMVWNTLVSNLAAGAAVVTYAGSPTFGNAARQFDVIETTGATMFAVGAAYLSLVEKSGMVPKEGRDLSSLRGIMSTGSPLPPSTWQWVHEAIRQEVHLGSDSGGTDVCSGFVGSNPISPVYLGESQGPLLGVAVQAWRASGIPVVGEVGEMVITRPMPSMPLYLWGDSDGKKYQESYFSTFPGVWAQGDWITETERHGFVVHGRSDATLNRQGVRLGSGDIYAALQDLESVSDSLVIGVERSGGGYWMPLFVQLPDGVNLDEQLENEIVQAIRSRASARHVPDEVVACPEIPLTHAGKRIEVPLKKLFSGMPLDLGIVRDTLRNPQALDWFVELARIEQGDRA